MIVGQIDRKYSVFVIESNCGDQLFFKDSERLSGDFLHFSFFSMRESDDGNYAYNFTQNILGICEEY